ncbi:recombinase family protein [Dendrosporobacter sp. 1207_IL3150]|uniref:recombinase family protein n=1 Tax=Dendrosporobacter sp. 1207_IL3150 TaxID=3084054 RepID=UPI002FD8E263
MRYFYERFLNAPDEAERYSKLQNKYSIDELFVEKAAERKLELERLLEAASPGDTVYIESFTMAARDLTELFKLFKGLKKCGLNLVSINEKLNTHNPAGVLRFNSYYELVEFDREAADERRREGIRLALAEKRPYGRPRVKITDELRKAYLQWKKGKITAVEAMRRAKLKRNTFYKLVKQLDEEFKGVPLFNNISDM